MLRIRASILHTPQIDTLEVLEDHIVEVGPDGRIASVEPASDQRVDVSLDADAVLLPGLIDTHLHAPQWPQLGTGLDLALDRWLFEHTFPLEARFEDEAFARQVWADMVPTLLSLGTTTAVYYSSIHEPATVALAEQCVRSGQRAFVGRVAMDHPDGTPASYRDTSAGAAVEASARVHEAIEGLDDPNGLVESMVTPRFIPACSDAALAGLSELAESTGARIQTHVSEGDWEHGHVLERTGMTDTAALAERGLIQPHTVLAHATHLTDADRGVIRQQSAGIAHCPLSNAYFANAVFPLRRNLDAGLRIGLGTDVAGGSTASMLAQSEHAVTASRLLEDGVDVTTATAQRGVANSRVDVVTAFHLATVGGADVLGIDAGRIAPGYLFDAMAVAVGPTHDTDDWPRIFEKIVRRGASADVRQVWVGGRQVY